MRWRRVGVLAVSVIASVLLPKAAAQAANCTQSTAHREGISIDLSDYVTGSQGTTNSRSDGVCDWNSQNTLPHSVAFYALEAPTAANGYGRAGYGYWRGQDNPCPNNPCAFFWWKKNANANVNTDIAASGFSCDAEPNANCTFLVERVQVGIGCFASQGWELQFEMLRSVGYSTYECQDFDLENQWPDSQIVVIGHTDDKASHLVGASTSKNNFNSIQYKFQGVWYTPSQSDVTHLDSGVSNYKYTWVEAGHFQIWDDRN